jgi:hypothetical protein
MPIVLTVSLTEQRAHIWRAIVRQRLSEHSFLFWLLATFLLAIAFPGAAEETKTSQVHQTADAIYKELNGIDKNLHRQIRQTAGRKRATASLDDLKITYDLSRKNHQCPIYFGQATAQSRFSGSGKFSRIPLADLAAKLKAGDLTPDDVPIEFIWIDGKRVTLNNRSLTALYKAGKGPTKLINVSADPSAQSPAALANTLRRLEGMAGKPSTEMLVRTAGLGPDGQPKETSDWDAPIGEVVSMPEDLLMEARTCRRGS